MDMKNILDRNQKWIDEKLQSDKDYFTKLSKGQNPEILYIGCSDSRVTAEAMIGAEPGEVFVHRNIANQVIATDASISSVIQYAVEFLKVKHIVICGHYGCGGVNAALSNKDMGQINNWVEGIRDVFSTHFEELSAISDPQEKSNKLVELNVLEQALNVCKMYHVQRARCTKGFPIIHGWVFDIHTGKIIDLKLNMNKEFERVQKIYEFK
jgi:carbonic anhydrase